ncbi:DUF349 domain-containing protein [Mesonia aestuariivivens]|uniref:DUF349 domain-containing protein n=1 Tax=Mesonia aestuariivivens TaxID=2796128 RepID=A0ABS6W062_9FLAO|nr:DUF349 domain-containing protein [Mesonia aestuariivivens]MBW2961240.1 DUF349 domain-containing protein [Mesonia aestuariivivens]
MSEKEKSQAQQEHKKDLNSLPATDEANTTESNSDIEQSMIDESQKEPTNTKNEELNSQSEDEAETAEENVSSEEKVEATEEDTHQSELDDAIAEDSEDEDAHERHGIEMKDYHAMSMSELVKELSSLLKNEKIQLIKDHVKEIKTEFDAKFEEEMEQKKEDFLEEGGNIIDFHYSSPIKKEFNSIYFDYKEKRNNYYQQLKNNLQKNLEERLAIIEELKGMIGTGADMGANFNQFKELQERWKKAGPVPREEYKMVWNTYHHHVENFYDFLHLDREFRDMDFKHNLEQKLKMIARAEELAEETNINRAFRELQMLHKMWKEDVGPVAKEYREDIWEKFSAATKKIHENRQVHFAELDQEKEKNLEAKLQIIGAIKEIADKEITSHNQAQQQIKKIESFRDQFFKAGKVPLKVNEDTWKIFKENVRNFNRKKNAYYKDLKKEQYKNLERKLELVEIAEDNKNNEDFKATTPIMKKIQSNWREIGHVPRKDSDKIWKRFKDACNHYFDRVHSVKNEENKEENEAFDKKKELLDATKSLELQSKPEEDLKLIKTKISEWKEIGRVPYNKRYIEGKFNKVLDQLFSQLDIGRKEAEMMKYENRVQALDAAHDSRQIEKEESFLRKKISETKAEITQLENNMQFFSNADESNSLFREVLKNIERHKVQLETWKAKLKKVKSL